MPYVNSNGQQIWYTDTGGDKPAVLFLHGFMMAGEMFEPQIEALRDHYRCITLDERGHGRTKESGGEFTIWDLADDAVGVLDHLGVDQAVLAGMSQGGFISLRVALKYPDRVRALVLMDTEAEGETAENKEALYAMFGDWSVNGPKNYGTAAAGMLLADPDLEALWISKWELIDPARVREPSNAIIERDSVLDRLGEIACPVLQIHGTDDEAITLPRAELLNKGLSNVKRFVVVEGARHAPNMTHRDIVNAAMEEFLELL